MCKNSLRTQVGEDPYYVCVYMCVCMCMFVCDCVGSRVVHVYASMVVWQLRRCTFEILAPHTMTRKNWGKSGANSSRNVPKSFIISAPSL